MFLKKIIDVKISRKTISVSREANISTRELEDQISKLQFSGERNPKTPQVENAPLPPFIQSFYYLFFKSLRIPTEKEFCDYYLELIGGSLNGKVVIDGETYDLNPVIYRMKRSYPSLLRDLHFLYLLEESGLFEEVEYSMHKDFYNGLDIKVRYSQKDYFVSLFIDSSRGTYYKARKRTRHDYTEVNEIEFNVEFSTLKSFGSIYLLTPEHIKILIDRIPK